MTIAPATDVTTGSELGGRVATSSLEVGLDLDGVCYDFVEAFRGYLNLAHGRPLDELPYAEVWDFYKYQWGMTTAEFLEHYAEGVRAGHIFTVGEPAEGMLDAIGRILDGGCRIHIVTARSVPGAVEEAHQATRSWLAEWNVPHDTLVFSDDKTVVPTDVFLEDNADNYLALESTGRCSPYLFDRPWNRHIDGRRVFNWHEFADIVLDLR